MSKKNAALPKKTGPMLGKKSNTIRNSSFISGGTGELVHNASMTSTRNMHVSPGRKLHIRKQPFNVSLGILKNASSIKNKRNSVGNEFKTD
jgi:hypothetical protein